MRKNKDNKNQLGESSKNGIGKYLYGETYTLYLERGSFRFSVGNKWGKLLLFSHTRCFQR